MTFKCKVYDKLPKSKIYKKRTHFCETQYTGLGTISKYAGRLENSA